MAEIKLDKQINWFINLKATEMKDTRSEYVANVERKSCATPYFMQRKPSFSLLGFLWNVASWISIGLVGYLFLESIIRNS